MVILVMYTSGYSDSFNLSRFFFVSQMDGIDDGDEGTGMSHGSSFLTHTDTPTEPYQRV